VGAALYLHVSQQPLTARACLLNGLRFALRRSPKGAKRDRPNDTFNLFSPPAPPNQKRK
jgi:hypothetical protein